MPYITGQGEKGSADLTLGVSWPQHSRSCCNGAMGCNSKSPPESAESLLKSRAGRQAAEQGGHLQTLGAALPPRLLHLPPAPPHLPGPVPLSPRWLRGDSLPQPLCLTPPQHSFLTHP